MLLLVLWCKFIYLQIQEKQGVQSSLSPFFTSKSEKNCFQLFSIKSLFFIIGIMILINFSLFSMEAGGLNLNLKKNYYLMVFNKISYVIIGLMESIHFYLDSIEEGGQINPCPHLFQIQICKNLLLFLMKFNTFCPKFTLFSIMLTYC